MTNIAIFASGSGSNAQRIAEYFAKNPNINIKLILTNNKNAGVIKRSEALGINCILFNKTDFYESELVINTLREHEINFVVLAGFLLLVPKNLINEYGERMVNIHPALLPDYGGKGMYGMNVHSAVIQNKEKESGITIHFVNNEYDRGRIIFQAKCPVYPQDTPELLAQRIHQLEYEYYPRVIESLVG